MSEEQFKNTYIATFLASYMASVYDSECASGHRRNVHNNQPVEDAIYMADLAWKQYQEELA